MCVQGAGVDFLPNYICPYPHSIKYFHVMPTIKVDQGIIPRSHRLSPKEATLELLDAPPCSCHAREANKDADARWSIWPDEDTLDIAMLGTFLANLARQLVVNVRQVDHVLQQDHLARLAKEACYDSHVSQAHPLEALVDSPPQTTPALPSVSAPHAH